MNLVTVAAWCAALFLASTLFSHTVALRLLLLLAGIALLAAEALRSRLRRASAPATSTSLTFVPPLLWPFALWAAWAAASLFWTLDAEITRKELRNEIVYAFGAFWLCFVAAQAPRAARIFGAVAAAGAVLVCLEALAEPTLTRLRGGDQMFLYGGPGVLTSTLLLLYPCTLAFAWFAWTRRWHAAWTALALLLVPLYAAAGYGTQNRVLWIGFAGETAILALLLIGRPALARGAKVSIALCAAVTIAGAAVLTFKVHEERFASGPMAQDPRPQLWLTVLRKIEERPLAGIGFGRGIARQELRAQQNNTILWHSHNLFLDTALQLGWPGLGLLLLLFGWTAGIAWHLARSTNDVAFACGLALLALIAGTMARNMTDVLWVRQSALLYWAAVGVLLAWGMKGEGAKAGTR